ncbi:MAG: hypothetical protein ACTSYH_03620 [Candidatus Heimdallarchaeaceae archaeon]
MNEQQDIVSKSTEDELHEATSKIEDMAHFLSALLYRQGGVTAITATELAMAAGSQLTSSPDPDNERLILMASKPNRPDIIIPGGEFNSKSFAKLKQRNKGKNRKH